MKKKSHKPDKRKEIAPGKKNPLNKKFTNEKDLIKYKKQGYKVEKINKNGKGIQSNDDAMLVNLGRDHSYTPISLLEKFIEYVKWGKKNPLLEAKLDRGKIKKLEKVRAISGLGFRLFAGISRKTWWHYTTGNITEGGVEGTYDLHLKVTSYIEDFIYQFKMENASADLLNSNIISRELGLTDKREVKGTIITGEESIEFE